MQKHLARIAELTAEVQGLTEVDGSLSDIDWRIKEAFHAAYSPEDRWEGPYSTRDVFADHPVMGDSIVVLDKKAGVFQAATYTDTGESVEFAPRAEWQAVELTYQFVTAASESEPGETPEALAEVDISECAGHAFAIAEQGDVATGGSKPLIMTVRPIKAGWGNKRQNHYYPLQMLQENFATAYDDVKMYETNHIPSEANNRNWVSTYMETQEVDGVGPVGKVGVHDPVFAQKVLNLQELGLLEKLECSILGPGKAQPYSEAERTGKQIVELGRGRSIDWVSKGGAGGQALSLAESEEGTMTDKEKKAKELAEAEAVIVKEGDNDADTETVTLLESATVEAALAKTTLPQTYKSVLALAEYADEATLKTAIDQAVNEVKEITGAGQPHDQGESTSTNSVSLTEAEIEAESKTNFNQLMAKIGLKEV